MAYVDYQFYIGEYKGGAIPESAFLRMAEDASGFIDQITYGRLKNGSEITHDVKMAVCAVADVVQSHVTGNVPSGVTSESVGSYSVSYEDADAIRMRRNQEKAEAAGRYLLRSDPLRYAGV